MPTKDILYKSVYFVLVHITWWHAPRTHQLQLGELNWTQWAIVLIALELSIRMIATLISYAECVAMVTTWIICVQELQCQLLLNTTYTQQNCYYLYILYIRFVSFNCKDLNVFTFEGFCTLYTKDF